MESLIPKLEKSCVKCIYGDALCPIYFAFLNHERKNRNTEYFYNDMAFEIFENFMEDGKCKMFENFEQNLNISLFNNRKISGRLKKEKTI